MGKLLRNAGLLLASIAFYAYQPTKQRFVTLGITRPVGSIQNVHGSELRIIEDTKHCEDLHLWPGNGLLYTACEGQHSPRMRWFPPMTVFDQVPTGEGDATGSLYVLDPKTFTSQRLRLDGFKGPFVTHGIDLAADPLDPDSIYVHAVNHLPDPDTSSGNHARSQIEIFHHKLGSDSARHVRSVRHPLIRVPNDILSLGPGEFYVTNDHKYRQGLKRTFEILWMGSMSHITETIHVRVDIESKDGDLGVSTTVAIDGMHNNNGLGHGATEDEAIICDAAGGVLHLAKIPESTSTTPRLELVDSVHLDSTIDNPSYYRDPYPTRSCDTSGYILAGLLRGIDYDPHFRNESYVDPSVVWHLSKSETGTWRKRIIFQDDGDTLSSASTAVLLPLDQVDNGDRKEGWLWVTGPSSFATLVTKIDLTTLCE